MGAKFSGFPKEMFEFLDELARNNNRAWFTANKGRYDHAVVEPVTHFIEAVGDFLPAISKAFVADTRRNGGSMFRIFRDIRFSKDKRPYKENVGCQFRHIVGRDAHAPGFYVHLAPQEVFIGGGSWTPNGPVLDKIRTAIVESPDQWSGIINDRTFSGYFGQLKGESLKRPPRGYDPEHPHVEDLKRKSYIAFKHVTPSLALKPAFFHEVERAFSTASPLMRFIAQALEISY